MALLGLFVVGPNNKIIFLEVNPFVINKFLPRKFPR